MSFYVFLLVTSLVCYSQGRPAASVVTDAQTSNPSPATNPTSTPNSSEATNTSEESDEQNNIDVLLKQVQTSLDAYITPYMVNITKEDQDVLKNLVQDEFAGSVNYVLYIIQELNDPSYNGGVIDPNANDFIVELDSFNPYPDVPFIEQNDSSTTQ